MDRLSEAGKLRRCIALCRVCAESCQETALRLLAQEDHNGAGVRQQRLADCAAICEATAGFLERGSPYAGEALTMCADICEACAEECGEKDSADKELVHCIAVCKDCEACCRELDSVAV